MNIKASIESFEMTLAQILFMWADTRFASDGMIDKYMHDEMVAMINSQPAMNEAETKLVDEVIDDLEFLSDMLDTNCRHNTYQGKI